MLSENEVCRAEDVAFSIYLVSDLRQEGVLVAIKTDTVVALRGAVSGESNGLRALAVGVLDVDVVEFGVCCVVLYSASGLVVGGAAGDGGAMRDIYDVGGVGRGVCGVAVYCERCSSRWDNDLFIVGPGVDKDALGSGGCGA